LIKQFGFGNITSFRAANITKRIPKYKNVKVKDVDLGDRAFYSGKYTGYSDEELMEVIDSNLFYSKPEWTPMFDQGREDSVSRGKLVHFRQIDKNLELPPGTARRLLVLVAERYNLMPYQQTDNIIRFKHAENTNKSRRR
jgi:hypothetical protein